jgi:hypothetical protein
MAGRQGKKQLEFGQGQQSYQLTRKLIKRAAKNLKVQEMPRISRVQMIIKG